MEGRPVVVVGGGVEGVVPTRGGVVVHARKDDPLEPVLARISCVTFLADVTLAPALVARFAGRSGND